MPERNIAEILSIEPKSITVADVGAAFYGQKPIYQPVLGASLARLFAFDADAKFATELRALYPDATVFQIAIADGAEHVLNICPAGMTSLLKPDPDAFAFFNLFSEWGKVERTIPLKTQRLDDVTDLPAIDFLKMDIQGSELMALRGGREKLAQCVAVQVEVSFVPLYKDQPTYGEIDLELRAQGFMPHCFAELKQWSIAPTIRQGNPRLPFHQLLEADIVYVRNMVKASTLSSDQLRKLAAVAHLCYNSPDLTARCIIELEARREMPRGAVAEYLSGVA
jgi:FkbM family methyltransferase